MGKMGEHRPLGNTAHTNIRKTIQPKEITECFQVPPHHRKAMFDQDTKTTRHHAQN